MIHPPMLALATPLFLSGRARFTSAERTFFTARTPMVRFAHSKNRSFHLSRMDTFMVYSNNFIFETPHGVFAQPRRRPARLLGPLSARRRPLGGGTSHCDMDAQHASGRAEGSLHARTPPHPSAETRGDGLSRVSSSWRLKMHFSPASLPVSCCRVAGSVGAPASDTMWLRTRAPAGHLAVDSPMHGVQPRMLPTTQNLHPHGINTGVCIELITKGTPT